MLMRLLSTTLLALTCTATMAAEPASGGLQIENPWARALPPNAPAGAAYFVIRNGGESADRLLGASSAIAEKTELHTHVHSGEVMKMQQIDSAAIAAGETLRFAPGGNHVMFFGLKQPLVAGNQFALTLEFETAGKLDVEVQVLEQAPVE
jgi:periplasmic copper chaperone A